MFDHQSKNLYKDPSKRSQMAPAKAAKQPSVKDALTNIHKALHAGCEDNVSAQEAESQLVPYQSAQLNAAGRMSQVEDARHSRTTTTLSVVDGHMGRAFINVRKNDLSIEKLNALNHEYRAATRLAFNVCTQHV